VSGINTLLAKPTLHAKYSGNGIFVVPWVSYSYNCTCGRGWPCSQISQSTCNPWLIVEWLAIWREGNVVWTVGQLMHVKQCIKFNCQIGLEQSTWLFIHCLDFQQYSLGIGVTDNSSVLKGIKYEWVVSMHDIWLRGTIIDKMLCLFIKFNVLQFNPCIVAVVRMEGVVVQLMTVGWNSEVMTVPTNLLLLKCNTSTGWRNRLCFGNWERRKMIVL